MRKINIKISFLVLALGLAVVIGISTLVISFSAFQQSKATQHAFAGDGQMIKYPGLDWQHFKSHEFQQYVEALLNKKLRLRNFFIHTNNQLYFSLFKKSFVDESTIVIGKHQQLFQKLYIDGYCSPQVNQLESVKAWALKLKQLHEFFAAKNIFFLYAITPSKVEYMPQALPRRFHCQNRGLNPRVVLLEKLLQEYRVPYINGSRLMKTGQEQYQLDMFPQGGTHWNWLGSALEAQAIMDLIRKKTGARLQPLHFDYTLGQIDHSDNDGDLIDMLKLMKPDLSYAVPKLHFKGPYIRDSQLSLTLVGGSFTDNMLKIWEQNQVFSKITYFNYYTKLRTYRVNQKDPHDVYLGPHSPQITNAILHSKVVILEENSALVASSEHGRLFYEGILGGLRRWSA